MQATEPRVIYHVTLADLLLMADAACEIDATKAFYVDQPCEQMRLAGMVERLHDTIERAAQQDAAKIYGESEDTRP